MAAEHPGAEELAEVFANVAMVLAAARTVDELLARVANLAAGTIDGCRLAGVTARDEARIVVLAVTEPLALELDEMQIRHGEGPCIDVLERGDTVYASDLAGDARWPRFAPHAVDAGIRSLLSVHLGVDETPGALNLYAPLPDAYGTTELAQAAIFATHAGLALSLRKQRDDDAALSEQLRSALTTRQLIGQAQGILMGRDRLTADQAFDVLREASQHLNVKLRDIAQRLVDTGEHPGTWRRHGA